MATSVVAPAKANVAVATPSRPLLSAAVVVAAARRLPDLLRAPQPLLELVAVPLAVVVRAELVVELAVELAVVEDMRLLVEQAAQQLAQAAVVAVVATAVARDQPLLDRPALRAATPQVPPAALQVLLTRPLLAMLDRRAELAHLWVPLLVQAD